MKPKNNENNLVILLDITSVSDNNELLEKLDDAFGFVEWWGKNFNAAADCLMSIYFSDQTLCKINNYKGSETIIECKAKEGQEKFIIYIFNLLSYVNNKLYNKTSGRFSIRPI